MMVFMIRKPFERKKRSKIWTIAKTELADLVKRSSSLSAVLTYFELSNKGGNSRTLKQRLSADQIDFSHIKLGCGHNTGRKFTDAGMTKDEVLSNVFVRHSKFTASTVKRYLKRFSLIPPACKCGLADTWQEKPIVLQLEHKDGDRTNQLLTNLTWLCPNCHSQTPTFAGRNNIKVVHPPKISQVNPTWRTDPRPARRKVLRPDASTLQQLVHTTPMRAIGRQFGVSDNAVRKWCRSAGIPL
ncbi:MAG: hypothetical protein EBU46_20985 [Nitrosomonadaceae bacterium]|nr:hypothetical protein [Nitrosomonadaceae bacterium]